MPTRDQPHDWALTADGDLEIPLRYTRGIEAVRQSCQVQIRAVRGEWFADVDDGVRWSPTITVPARLALLGQRFSRARTIDEIRDALLRAYAVTRVDFVDATFDGRTRHVTINWRVTTVWDDPVSGEETL